MQAELCTHPKFKVILSDIVESVNQGKSFSEALEEHDDVFDDYYVSMVRGGEASGTLGVILGRLAEYMQKKQKLRGTIIGVITSYSIHYTKLYETAVAGSGGTRCDSGRRLAGRPSDRAAAVAAGPSYPGG